MKEVYSFPVNCGTEEKEDLVKVAFIKPSNSMMEDAEFYYGQQFNRLMKAGFMSRAMMDKEFGDLGGVVSKQAQETFVESLTKMLEAQRVIEFYGGAESLSDEQEQKLKDSTEIFAILQKQIAENDVNLRNMYAQSADAKAEESLMKWFVLNCSYFYEEVLKDGQKKSELFTLFDAANINDKKAQLDQYLEDEEEGQDQLNRKKRLVLKSLPQLNKAISLWYNGFGTNQAEIEEAFEKVFGEEKEPPKKKTRTKK